MYEVKGHQKEAATRGEGELQRQRNTSPLLSTRTSAPVSLWAMTEVEMSHAQSTHWTSSACLLSVHLTLVAIGSVTAPPKEKANSLNCDTT